MSKIDEIKESVDKVDSKCDRMDTSLTYMTAKFEEHLKQHEKIYEEFKGMVQISRENTDSLKEHVLRTNMLQQMVLDMHAQLDPIVKERIKKEAVSDFIRAKAARWAKIASMVAAFITIIYYVLHIRSGA